MGPPHNQTQPRMRLRLALQTTLVLLFAGRWALVHGKPPTPISLLLLALACLAMVRQRAWARQNGASTPSLTGTLTAAVADAATGQGLSRHRWALIRRACLLVGAMSTPLALVWWPPAAALVPATYALGGALLWWR